MTAALNADAKCLVCQQGSDDVPLITFHYKGAERFICAQHLPMLIHKPAELAHLLPGVEGLDASGTGH